jgi:NAD+ kinase
VSGRRVFAVMTHRRPEETAPALHELLDRARELGIDLFVDREEADKHGLSPRPGLEIGDSAPDGVELCVVLGGDGTILRALRRFGPNVPVLAINFGTIGFLATLDRDQVSDGLSRACRGEFELMHLPGLRLELSNRAEVALNDISFHRPLEGRVADLAYMINGEEVGRVRCDGLVVATAAGSTGYNLANGGPLLAWGVAGYVVSFIAPHTLTARAVVAAPSDVISIANESQEAVDVIVDGRHVCELGPGEAVTARVIEHVGTLAQLPGYSFYQRLRSKFGLLAR